MKVKFTESPAGRPHHKAGDVVDFEGHVAETYARKYIARGWAVEHKEEAKQPVQKPPLVATPVVAPTPTEPAKPTLGLPFKK